MYIRVSALLGVGGEELVFVNWLNKRCSACFFPLLLLCLICLLPAWNPKRSLGLVAAGAIKASFAIAKV